MEKNLNNENVNINTNLYLEVEIGKTYKENAEALVYNLGLLVASQSATEEDANGVDLETWLMLDPEDPELNRENGNYKTVADLQHLYTTVFEDVDDFTAQIAAMQTFMLLMPHANYRGIWYGLGEDLEKAYNVALEEAFMSEDEF